MKGRTTRLNIAILVLSLLFVTCGRGHWTVAQCLHATLPPVVQLHSDHNSDRPSDQHGYAIHHHAMTLSHTVDNATHHIVHIMDSIEYSVPVALPYRKADKPEYSWIISDPRLPADVIPVPLYRPPRTLYS